MQETERAGNLALGVLSGLIAAVAVAIIWGALTAATQFQIGYMAIGVGFAVAFAVRFFGRGHDRRFAIASAILAVLGCALGNYFAVCAVLSAQEHVSAISATVQLLPRFADVMAKTFNGMDILFYAIGAYFGYKYAIAPPARTQAALEDDAQAG
ncbi:MAG: hypothetical protein ACXWNK_03790 [Vulcanimicrobiaceae bacterium]